MYLLLNLKDENSLSHVVNLLFANGYSAITLGQAIESLCPSCCETSGMGKPYVPQRGNDVSSIIFGQDPSSSSPSPRERGGHRMHASSHYRRLPQISISTVGNSTNGSAPGAPGVSSQSSATSSGSLTKGELVQSHDIPTQEREEVVFDNGEYSASELIVAVAEMKQENSMDDRDSPIDVEDDSFNVHQALEMLGHQATSGATTPSYEPGKKRRRLGTITTTAQSLDGQTITEEIIISPEAFQCQVCKKSISRTGQYANLINHLSRHAKLHAQKKQYACPVCSSSFSRRYLCVSHIKDVHPHVTEVNPIDYSDELKEEYRTLLEVCFPMMEQYRRPVKRDDHVETQQVAQHHEEYEQEENSGI